MLTPLIYQVPLLTLYSIVIVVSSILSWSSSCSIIERERKRATKLDRYV